MESTYCFHVSLLHPYFTTMVTFAVLCSKKFPYKKTVCTRGSMRMKQHSEYVAQDLLYLT